MGDYNLSSATITDFSTQVPDFIVTSKALDVASPNQSETYYYFDKATQWFGYAMSIAEIYSAASSLCTWAFSRGYKAQDSNMKAQLDHVRGAGNSNFIELCWQHDWVCLVVGDSFMEVKRNDKGDILNMIPISPERIRIVYNKQGLIKRYDTWDGGNWKAIKKENMLHSSNNKIADSMGGTSQLEAAKFVIDARNEALADERIIKHRDKALGIVYYKTEKSGKISYVNSQIEQAVKKGEMVGLPEGQAEIKPYPSRSSEDRQAWIQYLENFFYQIFGVPRSIASSDGTSEVGGKMGHVIFEPTYTRRQVRLENDLKTQQAIIVTFNRPPSLGGLVQEEEAKNTGQTQIQPNDSVVNLNRE